MELTPQAVSDAEFREAKRGGYNIRDVDDFLDQIAIGVGQLHERIREAHHRAEVAEANLTDAQRQLHEASFQQGAPNAVMPAGAPAPDGGETDETLRRTLMLAQRTADATIVEAKEEAARLVHEARTEAARIRSAGQAEGRGAEGHGDVLASREEAQRQVDRLLAKRAELEGDIAKLEDHIQAQRENLRAGLDELQELLEDREPLQVEPKPQLSEGVEQHAQPQPVEAQRRPVPSEAPPMFPVPDSDDLPPAAGNGFVPGSRLSADELSPFGRGRPAGGERSDQFASPPGPSPEASARPPLAEADHFGAEPERPPLSARGNPPLPARGASRDNPPLPSRGAEPLPAFEPPPERDPFAAPNLGVAAAEQLPARNPQPAPPPPPLAQRDSANVGAIQELPGSSPFGAAELQELSGSPLFGGPEPRQAAANGEPDSDDGVRGIFPPSLGPPPGATGFLPDLPQPPSPPPPHSSNGDPGPDAVRGGATPDAPLFPAPPSGGPPNGELPLSIDAPPPPPLDSGDRPSAWGRNFDDGADDESESGIRFGRK